MAFARGSCAAGRREWIRGDGKDAGFAESAEWRVHSGIEAGSGRTLGIQDCEMTEEILTPTRELIDGVYYCIHVSRDGRFRVNTGPDDQRPDDDGEKFFRPIVVANYLGDEPNSPLYSYVYYCGRCRKKMGGPYGHNGDFCDRCGAGVAHYIFAMGMWEWRAPWGMHDLPDQLPEFTDGCGFTFASAERKRLSSGTASEATSVGKD